MTTITPDNVTIAADGLIRASGISVFRRLKRDGKIYVQFYDHDRMRSQCRGSKFVEIPLDALVKLLKEKENEPNRD